MRKYKAILFDLDNTLFDFDACEHASFFECFKNHGIQATKEYYDIYRELNEDLWLRYEAGEDINVFTTRYPLLFKKLNIDLDGIQFDKEYMELLGNHGVLTEGCKEVLEYLSDQYILCVASNGVTKTQLNRMKISGIDEYMKDYFISDHIGYTKPSREFFQYCLNHLDFHKDEVLMVGDKLTSDILGGNQIGIDTCYFNKYHKVNISDIKPTYEVYSLLSLKEFL